MAEPVEAPERRAAREGLLCAERSVERVAAPPATSRHPNHSLPLLPSGPGGVCELSSRENRRSHHKIGDVIVWKSRKLAERAGFEPAKRFNPFTHFPGVLLQPLGHLSADHPMPASSAASNGSRRIPVASPSHKRSDGMPCAPYGRCEYVVIPATARAGARANSRAGPEGERQDGASKAGIQLLATC